MRGNIRSTPKSLAFLTNLSSPTQRVTRFIQRTGAAAADGVLELADVVHDAAEEDEQGGQQA